MAAAFGPLGAEGNGHILFGLHGIIKFFKFPVKGTFRNIRQKDHEFVSAHAVYELIAPELLHGPGRPPEEPVSCHMALFIVGPFQSVHIAEYDARRVCQPLQFFQLFHKAVSVSCTGQHVPVAQVVQPGKELLVHHAGPQKIGNSFQYFLGIYCIADFIVIGADVADKFSAIVNGGIHNAPYALPFQVFIVQRVIVGQNADVFQHQTGVVNQVFFPAPDIFFIGKILECVDFRLHPFPAPFKGIACCLSVRFQNVETVGMNNGTQLSQHVVHRFFVAFPAVHDFGKADDNVVGIAGLAEFHLFHMVHVHIHKDEGSPAFPCRFHFKFQPVAHFPAVHAASHLSALCCFIAIVKPSFIGIVINGAERAANQFFLPSPHHFAVGLIDIHIDGIHCFLVVFVHYHFKSSIGYRHIHIQIRYKFVFFHCKLPFLTQLSITKGRSLHCAQREH